MKSEIKDCVEAALRECNVKDTDGLLVGVSGGPDSVALLHILLKLHPRARLFAAHLNHGLRGAQAVHDAEFVRVLCEQWGVIHHEQYVDVPALKARENRTLEETARRARYAFLREVKEICGARYILTAHHMSDQAETVLMHLFRGSGLNGLAGIRMKNGDLLRPMLRVSRVEILNYLSREAIEYCTDETNFQTGYARNKIRLELVPLLEREYNPAIVEGLCQTAELLAQDETYLNGIAEAALKEAMREGGYDRQTLLGLPAPIQGRAARSILMHAGVKDIQRTNIARICALLSAPTGVRVPVGNGFIAHAQYDLFFIKKEETQKMRFETHFMAEGVTHTPYGTFESVMANALRRDEGSFVAYMDADRLPEGASARMRMPGDRFYPLGAPGSCKLKKYLIDKKIPQEARETPLIAHGNEVLFFPGGTVSNALGVTDATKRILRVAFLAYENEYDGIEPT